MGVSFTRKQYLKLWRGDRYISQHVSRDEAYESAINDAEAHGEGTYEIKVGDEIYYEVEVTFILGSGATVDETQPPPPVLSVRTFPQMFAPRIGRKDWGENPNRTGSEWDANPYEQATMPLMDFSVINGQPRLGDGRVEAMQDWLTVSQNVNPDHFRYQYFVLQETGGSLSGTIHDILVAEGGPPGQFVNPSSPVTEVCWYARDGDGNLEVVFGPDPGGNFATNITDYVVADSNGDIYPERYIEDDTVWADHFITPFIGNAFEGFYCDVFEFRPRENGLNYSGLGIHPNFSDRRDNAKDDWDDEVAGGGRGFEVAQKYRDGHRRGLNRLTTNHPGVFVGGNCAGHSQEYAGTDQDQPRNEFGNNAYYTEYQGLLHMAWLEHGTRDTAGGTSTFGGFSGLTSQGLLIDFGNPAMVRNMINYQIRHCIAPRHVGFDWKFESTNAEVDPTVGSNGVTAATMAMNRYMYCLVLLSDAFAGMCNHEFDNFSYYDRTPLMDYMGLHNTATTGLSRKWMGKRITNSMTDRDLAANNHDWWIPAAEIDMAEFENGLNLWRGDKSGSVGSVPTGDYSIPVVDGGALANGEIPGNIFKEIDGVQDPTIDAGRTVNEANFPSGYPLRRMDGRVFERI